MLRTNSYESEQDAREQDRGTFLENAKIAARRAAMDPDERRNGDLTWLRWSGGRLCPLPDDHPGRPAWVEAYAQRVLKVWRYRVRAVEMHAAAVDAELPPLQGERYWMRAVERSAQACRTLAQVHRVQLRVEGMVARQAISAGVIANAMLALCEAEFRLAVAPLIDPAPTPR